MEIGDLVILEYKGVDVEEKDRKKIGIVKVVGHKDMIKVLWSSGDQKWCLQEQLQTVKKCP